MSHYICTASHHDECKNWDRFWLADHTRLFVQYTISLSSLCKFIWRHWTYKMPVRYILSSVWVRLSIFSPLSIIQYVGLYVFSLPISLVMIERIYILCLIIIIKLEVWAITHCLGLGHETMVSTVCLSIFIWINSVWWSNLVKKEPAAFITWHVIALLNTIISTHPLLTLSLYRIIVPYIDGLVEDSSISIANAPEVLQTCTKPSIYSNMVT